MSRSLKVEEFNQCDGLYYIEDVIRDNNISKEIIDKLDKLKWIPLSSSPNSRKVQHYGYKYNYHTYDITEKCNDFPIFISKLANKLTKICLQLKLIDENYKFNQCIINNYNSGQGISSHIDVKSYGNVIGCITIGSGTTIKFTNDDEKFEKYVKSNSLYIMSNDSRYKWKHCIDSKKFDIVNNVDIPKGPPMALPRNRRISITFRNVPEKLLKK